MSEEMGQTPNINGETLQERLVRDYEGKWVGVHMDLLAHPRSREAVKVLIAAGVSVRVIYTGQDAHIVVSESILEITGKDLELTNTIDADMAEYWGMNSVQFFSNGERADALEADGAIINMQILATENGPELFIPEPKFQTADTQVVSLAMYVSKIVSEGMQVMMNAGGDEALKMAEQSVKDTMAGKGDFAPTPVSPEVQARKDSGKPFYVVELEQTSAEGVFYIAQVNELTDPKVLVSQNIDDAMQFDDIISAHDFRKEIIEGGHIEEEHSHKLVVRDHIYSMKAPETDGGENAD